jgi:hypothetical protein
MTQILKVKRKVTKVRESGRIVIQSVKMKELVGKEVVVRVAIDEEA